MTTLSLRLAGGAASAALVALALAGCGNATPVGSSAGAGVAQQTQPPATQPVPPPYTQPVPTPTPPSTSDDVTQVALWAAAGGLDAVQQVQTDSETISNATICYQAVPAAQQLIMHAEQVIEFDVPLLPPVVHVPLDAGMEHMQAVGRDVIAWCQAPSGSAAEAAAEAQGRADMAAAEEDIDTATAALQQLRSRSQA